MAAAKSDPAKDDANPQKAEPDDGRAEPRAGLPVAAAGSALVVLKQKRSNPLLTWLRRNGPTAAVAGVAGAVAGGLVAAGLVLGPSDGDGDSLGLAASADAGLGLSPGVSLETTGSIARPDHTRAEGWTL